MRTSLKITAAASVAALTFGLTACGSSAADSSEGPLVVGASPTPHAGVLKYIKDNLAKDAGLELEVKEYTDYVTPNTALEDGELGANYFQTQPYLEDFNKKQGTHLESVAAVHLEPLGLYSNQGDKLDDLKKGATIALPNDADNESRALRFLASVDLITLKSGAESTATPKDIAKNPKDLEFKEVDAAQTPRSLDDVDAAVVNGNYAIGAGLKPSEQALALETTKDNPYNNVLAVKKGSEDDPRVKKLAKLLTSPEVKKYIEEKYSDGSVLPSF